MTGLVRSDVGLLTLSGRGVNAVVSRRAAALRLLRVGSIDVVEPTTSAVDPPGMAGAVLAPWPNRVEGAAWWHDGVERRLPVTEPELGHANHGLLAATDFEIRVRSAGVVRLGARIAASDGYPFDVDVAVEYRLHPSGMDVCVQMANLGEMPAPVATGAHPYLRVGSVPAEQLRLSVAADHEWRLDAGNLPAERLPRAGGLRGVAFADAPRHSTFELADPGGGLSHTVEAPDGRVVEVHADSAYRFTQLWIAEALAADDGAHTAVAIEPMTAPPNALRSGIGLHWLEPGRSWTTRWGIRLRVPTPGAERG